MTIIHGAPDMARRIVLTFGVIVIVMTDHERESFLRDHPLRTTVVGRPFGMLVLHSERITGLIERAETAYPMSTPLNREVKVIEAHGMDLGLVRDYRPILIGPT